MLKLQKRFEGWGGVFSRPGFILDRSDIKVPVKFRRMGDLADFQAFGPLHDNPVMNEMLWEYAAGSQVIVVGFQGVQGVLQPGRKRGKLRFFFLREMEKIDVIGAPAHGMGIDLVFDPI